MRIAIYHNLPSGGAKRALYEIARGLSQNHQLDVYSTTSADHEFGDLRSFSNQHYIFRFQPLPSAKAPFGRLNQGARFIDLHRLRLLQKRIATEVDRRNYDIVFIHHCRYGQSPALVPYLATASAYYLQEPPRQLYEEELRRPYSVSPTQRLNIPIPDPLPRLYRSYLRSLDLKNTRAATTVLVNSYFSSETVSRVYGLTARVAYLGVDTDLFRRLRVPRKHYVLSVGQLNVNKGYDFVIEALSLIPARTRPPFWIVCNMADDREARYLRDLAAKKGVELRLHSKINDHNLVQLYNQARFTVYAPRLEPFGFVPLESMACGTPVIGVREGGLRETLGSCDGGILVDRSPSDFAKVMLELLQAPRKVEALGELGRQYVQERWSWQQSILRVEKCLSCAATGTE